MRDPYNYETPDPNPYPDAVQIAGHEGIAWIVLGFHLESVEKEWRDLESDETFVEWENGRSGRIVCRMIGDDARWLFDPEDIILMDREDYCGECGQVGCEHDGLDRS